MSVTDWDVRVALADQIRDTFATAVTDIVIHVEPSAFPVAETPSVTMFHGGPSGLMDAAAFGDLRACLELIIRVRCSAADIDAGEKMLSDFTDDGESDLSIIAAIDSDETIGGLAQTLKWGDWQGIIPIQTDAGDYILEEMLQVAIAKAHS